MVRPIHIALAAALAIPGAAASTAHAQAAQRVATDADDARFFAEIRRAHENVIEMSRIMIERDATGRAAKLARELLRDHLEEQRDLVAFAKQHAIQFDRNSALREQRRDVNEDRRDLSRLRKVSMQDLQKRFLEDVVDEERDALRVAEEGMSTTRSAPAHRYYQRLATQFRAHLAAADKVAREAH